MRRNVIIGISVVAGAIALLFTQIVNIAISFLLAGIIPGTPIVAPYWFMMAVYCTSISLIATPYLQKAIKLLYDMRRNAKKQLKPSRRRFTAIQS